MSNDPTWPVVGIDCMCMHRGPWYKYKETQIELFPGMTMIAVEPEEQPGPQYMAVLKVADIEYRVEFEEGHRVHLGFVEFPGHHYCACGFVPLEKLNEGEELARTLHADMSPGQKLTEPVAHKLHL